MQLASDTLGALVKRGMIPPGRHRELHLQVNKDLNPLRPDWVERHRSRCCEVGGFSEESWTVVFDDTLATSDVIRYVHLGNPEAILLANDSVVRRMVSEVSTA